MSFHRWLSEVEQRPDPASLGALTYDLPTLFFHFTHDQERVESIVANGFSLRHYGFSGKKFNVPDVTRNDPAGIYCQDAAEIANNRYRPWVTFRLIGRPRALTSRFYLFRDLADAYGCVGRQLTGKLLKQDIQVLQSVREFVILNPSIIELVDWSGKA